MKSRVFSCAQIRGAFLSPAAAGPWWDPPHRITFPRSRRHDYVSCIAFSHHFLSKEVNIKWHLVLTIVWCSLLSLLCESTAQESPVLRQEIIREIDYGQILAEQPLSSTDSMCSKEKCEDCSQNPSLQPWLGFLGCVTSALFQQHWCANIKGH